MTKNRQVSNRRKSLHYSAAILLLALALQCTSADKDAYNATPSIPNRYFKSYHGLNSWPTQDDDLLKSDIDMMDNKGIDSLLRVLLKRDQEVRIELETLRGMVDNNTENIKTLGTKMKKIDHANFILLSRIFDRIGWPSNSIFSDSAVNAAFYITLHNTHNDLSSLLIILEKTFTLEQIDISHYAVLVVGY